ncbi:MAG: hypothetical protein AAFP84_02005 [Actinomycetota bacterium]
MAWRAGSRSPLGLLAGLALAIAACGGGDADESIATETLVRIGDASPGDVVALRAAGPSTLEWVHRRDGEIMSLDVADPAAIPEVIAQLSVDSRGRRWGLLSTVVLGDGRRFASWTQGGSGDFENATLVVGEIVDGRPTRAVWNAGRVGATAIGGTLSELDGRIVLGLGLNVGWADDNVTSGALLSLDPDGTPDQEPTILSRGYVDPIAFTIVDDRVWVWDRADGDDTVTPTTVSDDQDDAAVTTLEPGASTTPDDVEHHGRADLADRHELTRSDRIRRSPTAMLALADGRIAVCGTDGDLVVHDVAVDGAALGQGAVVMPCDGAAAELDDGSLIAVVTADGGQSLELLRPADR